METFIAQNIHDARLVWSISGSCSHCGMQIEEDGVGFPPESVRNLILQTEGVWGLQLEQPVHQTALILKILREALELSLDETSALKTRLSDTVAVGTKTEMLYLQSLLSPAGARSLIQKLE